MTNDTNTISKILFQRPPAHPQKHLYILGVTDLREHCLRNLFVKSCVLETILYDNSPICVTGHFDVDSLSKTKEKENKVLNHLLASFNIIRVILDLQELEGKPRAQNFRGRINFKVHKRKKLRRRVVLALGGAGGQGQLGPGVIRVSLVCRPRGAEFVNAALIASDISNETVEDPIMVADSINRYFATTIAENILRTNKLHKTSQDVGKLHNPAHELTSFSPITYYIDEVRGIIRAVRQPSSTGIDNISKHLKQFSNYSEDSQSLLSPQKGHMSNFRQISLQGLDHQLIFTKLETFESGLMLRRGSGLTSVEENKGYLKAMSHCRGVATSHTDITDVAQRSSRRPPSAALCGWILGRRRQCYEGSRMRIKHLPNPLTGAPRALATKDGVGRGRERVSGSLTRFETVAAYADVHTMDGRTRCHGSVTWPSGFRARRMDPVTTTTATQATYHALIRHGINIWKGSPKEHILGVFVLQNRVILVLGASNSKTVAETPLKHFHLYPPSTYARFAFSCHQGP
ncbi:hypothetical protein J6590_037361 [Homalodisca vitripennis]|nr:hypothetical protein J6590_037361 [Homalodisca vitripennis]